jgi:hypothetical protein
MCERLQLTRRTTIPGMGCIVSFQVSKEPWYPCVAPVMLNVAAKSEAGEGPSSQDWADNGNCP